MDNFTYSIPMEKKVYEFMSAQNNDSIIERRDCEKTGESFPIFQSDIEFYKLLAPTFAGETFPIPYPKLCPDEREKRRTLRRNERKLYRGTCSASGKQIISQYSPDKPYKVFDQKVRWSDVRNPLDYGRDFDFSKTFHENYAPLYIDVPKLSLYNITPENSEYCHCCTDLKNCYLVTGAMRDEDCLYLHYANDNMKSIDCYMTHNSENCYECSDCIQCYKCFYTINSQNCRESYFLFGCDNCQNCFGCTNLVGKQYCIWNEQKTKEEYEAFISQANLGSRDAVQSHRHTFNNLFVQATKPAMYGVHIDKSYGNYIRECKQCISIFNGQNLEDCKYTFWFNDAKKCQDCMSRWSTGEMLYECVATWSNCSYNMCVTNSHTNSYVYYSSHCSFCHNCFWCTGLTNKEYCIFNKQYTKSEYETLVAKIIKHMQSTGERWEFFHSDIAPFAYNETVSNELHPLSKDEAIRQGFKRHDENEKFHETQAIKIADNIHEVQDDILQQAICCEVSGRMFKLTKQELDFYRKNIIPIPVRHPDVRHQARLDQRPQKKLHLRNCDKTGNQILSVYSDDVSFPVYSMEAYTQALYG